MTIIGRSEKKSSIWGTFILTHAVSPRTASVPLIAVTNNHRLIGQKIEAVISQHGS